jgi:choline dehydrogenase
MRQEAEYDYVIVGAGAGGGPLAANLAKAGFKVLLLDAGGDTNNLSYAVPAYNGLATEDQHFRWDYFVRHYTNEEQQRRDPKFVDRENGILYPRAGGIGGCTQHNAMITIYPSNSDWDKIAEITGDDSWKADAMRSYFEKVERCQYLDQARILAGRHGSSGWLATEKPDTTGTLPDWQLQTTVQYSLGASRMAPIKPDLDPNAWDVATERREGFLTVPLASDRHARNGPREFIRAVARQFPENLILQTHAFVTRVLLDAENKAIGVEYLDGAHLYKADPNSGRECSLTEPTRKSVYVRREVILAGGTFNTPQLLMLSGIGPREQLEQHGIEVKIDLPGVGKNLQDRYEIGVVHEMDADWTASGECTYSDDPDFDPCLKQWLEKRTGAYTSSGTLIAFLRRSTPDKADPDLFIFGFSAHFQGYFPLWFTTFQNVKNAFTWVVLKAHTHNTAGTVELRSADPRDTPLVNFHYFEEGNNEDGSDLDACVQGVLFARQTMQGSPYVKKELIPSESVQSTDEIKQFIRNQAWGHHCSCSCKIGADDDPSAVLDSNFRVRGAKNLRVVDASVFPYIPGYFIVLPIYMISEKAADVILQDARS